MNYNHLNKVYDYWRKEVLPYLIHNFTVASFDEYLKRFSYLPSGKWLKDLEKVKIGRLGFALDPQLFVKKYKDCCVAYNAPLKVDDGIQRVIYQFTPTLHAEMALWIWVEHEVLQSYCSLFFCYNNEKEFSDFSDNLYEKMRREGNTEENPKKSGFAALLEQAKALELQGNESPMSDIILPPDLDKKA
jgi:hypothetical protein